MDPLTKRQKFKELSLSLNDLPIEVILRIWKETILTERLSYHATERLAKEFRQVNQLLLSDFSEYDSLWEHFFRIKFCAPGKKGWDFFLGNEPPVWMASWKAYFFWCMLLERRCMIALGKSIWSRMKHKQKEESYSISLKDDHSIGNGPSALFVRKESITLPLSWKYIQGERYGELQLTYKYADSTFDRTMPYEALLDDQIRIYNELYPVFLQLWIYIAFHYGYRAANHETIELVDYREVFPRRFDHQDFDVAIFWTFVEQAFRTRLDDEFFQTRRHYFARPWNPRHFVPPPEDFVGLNFTVPFPNGRPPLGPPLIDNPTKIYIGCAACGAKSAAQVCGGCNNVLYCGEACAEKDWESHKCTEWVGKKHSKKHSKGEVSPEKAREILHHGEVHGHELTEKQRRYFGWLSNK